MPPTPRRKLSKPTKSTQPTDKKAENNPTSPEVVAADKISNAFEKKTGLSAESLKKLFEAKDVPGSKVLKLKEMLRARCLDARRFSLRDWRPHAASDEAYMAAFYQIQPTLISKILHGNLPTDPLSATNEIQRELVRWGLPESCLFQTLKNPDGTVKEKVLLQETFTNVKVPIAKAVTTARESRLFQERNNEPFMSYQPLRSSDEWTVMGEIITNLVAQMATSYGWKATYRTANHQSVKYSFAMMFPVESWHAVVDKDDDGKDYTVKEGLRYNVPHPTRSAWDQSCRPSTFNSDSGCTWAAYWRLAKFGDVDRNPAYYNKDKISYSADNWTGGAYEAYFRHVYPCIMEFPWQNAGLISRSKKDREAQAWLYSENDYDKAIFLTDMFCKLSPKQWGLSDYEPEVWIGFVMASDGMITYAAPYPYTPVLYLGSDADDGISNSVPAFTLEAIPWQDLVGNILSDILQAMRSNSIKVVFYDEKMVTQEKIGQMITQAKQALSISWFPIDWRDIARGQVSPDLFFKVFTFPQQNLGEKINTLNTVLNTMERSLGISAQDVGAIATHTQTRGEVDIIARNSDTRLELCSSMGDDFFDAWKRQALRAYKAFGDEEFTVDVSGVTQEIADKMKEKYGFEFDDIRPGQKKTPVKGKKSKLSIDAFISSREGRLRQNNAELAKVIFQAIAGIANTSLADRIGPEQIVAMWNRGLHLAGIAEDARWKISPEATSVVEQKKLLEELQKFAKEIAAQAATQATQQAVQEIGKQVAPAIQQATQTAQAAEQGLQQISQQSHQTDAQIVSQLEAHKAELAQLVLRIDGLQKLAASAQPPMQPQLPPQLPPQGQMPV